VFSYLRTLTTWHCPQFVRRTPLLLAASRAAIDRYLDPACRAHSSKPGTAGVL